MVQRLFFDGIDIARDRFAIGKSVQGSGFIFADPANAEILVFDPAVVRAQMALHLAVFQFPVEHGLRFHFSSPDLFAAANDKNYRIRGQR